ncbi:MAG: PhoH family protein [Candidatus Eisenbacteria bacterium]|nr:PhoH family protein [Candidatus Eisenbacteria bacterium]
MEQEITEKLSIENIEPLRLLGREDCNLRIIEARFKARVVVRNDVIAVSGPENEVRPLVRVLEGLIALVKEGRVLEEHDVSYAIDSVEEQTSQTLDNAQRTVYHLEHLSVSPRTVGQAKYLKAIEEFDVVFSIGPAGTGKTYLAVAAAVNALKVKIVDRILLVRPAVEAGESLGFLPGGFEDKVNPYMRPLYDALHEMLSFDRMKRFIELGVIEIAPLAYMRGRTLSNSFVILDEGQNTTLGQMKMFLTRLGAHSRAVVTGDITQVDLADSSQSGLIQVQSILGRVEGIKFIYLTERDVVRHKLVKDIIMAFEAEERKRK